MQNNPGIIKKSVNKTISFLKTKKTEGNISFPQTKIVKETSPRDLQQDLKSKSREEVGHRVALALIR